MRLLLIEDDQDVAQLLADAFGVDGHEVTVAITGEEGLAQLARAHPEAVVLDVRLPTLSGVAVLRQIRLIHPDLPVIIMTGLATAGELEEIRRLGVEEVIEKPELLSRFGEALARIADRAEESVQFDPRMRRRDGFRPRL